MKSIVILPIVVLSLIATTAFSATTNTLAHKLEINTGNPLRLNAANAKQLVGPRGIIMGTCRQIKGQPLTLQGVDNRNYVLPDGVYESGQGFRIHIRKGGIERISLSTKVIR